MVGSGAGVSPASGCLSAPTWHGHLARERCLSATSGNKPAALRAVHGQDGRATRSGGFAVGGRDARATFPACVTSVNKMPFRSSIVSVFSVRCAVFNVASVRTGLRFVLSIPLP
ncbi:hypothetical protein OpiT1DRAFT_04357 [Opitutaceae bacterium TAV1]|nr:hypothetical protein OpiT1DRAFT_04357 [Opitutaceae bacterium TAV1]